MSRRILVHLLGMTLVASPGLAADLPTKAPVPAAVPAWTGFYIGLNAGYGWGTGGSAQTTGIPVADNIYNSPFWGTPYGFTAAANSGAADLSQSGFVAGVQLGYDYQISPNLVAGLEADLQGTGISGSGGYNGFAQYGPDLAGFIDTARGAGVVSADIDWLGTVRARLGYLVTPTLMLYGTGGLAYGRVVASSSHAVVFTDDLPEIYPTLNSSGSYSGTRFGWTAGGGGEWLVSPHWSVKAEALYYDLGSVSFAASPVGAIDPDGALLFANSPVTRVKYDGVIVRAGINYRFNGDAAPAAAEAAAPVRWAGFYAGLNAGYGWNTGSRADTLAVPVVDNIAADPFWGTPYGFTAAANSGGADVTQSGFVGGGQIGYNFQLTPSLVAGLEADLQGSSIEGSGSYSGFAQFGPDNLGYTETAVGTGTVTAGVDWLGTVRARLGHLVTPSLMVYVTGGLAYGRATASSTNSVQFSDDFPEVLPTFNGAGSYSKLRTGWTLGGGGEWMVTRNWSVRLEALYYDLGSASFNSTPVGALDPDGSYLVGGGYGGVLFANMPVTQVKFDGVIARAGINYRFDWGGAAL